MVQASPYDPLNLFRADAAEAFELGATAALLEHRNLFMGHLLLAERNLFYVQILYRMLITRRTTHELEPLYEDIYDSVRPAQELLAQAPYSSDQFRADLNQLTQWELVSFRIEKDRIRGYRDNRKKKFRYRLLPEAIAFLSWLETRLQDDIEDRNADARNQLEDFSVSLEELLRLLRKFKAGTSGEERARRILYQLFKLEEITLAINANLGEVNARLLSFINRTYNHEDLKHIIVALETYLQNFLRKIDRLRREIEPSLELLNQDAFLEKITVAFKVMEEERKKAPHFLRGSQPTSHRNIPGQLLAFHRGGGLLDQLCGRIHEASFLVVRKMYAYLRELDRRSNRIEDIRERLLELTALDEDTVPHEFVRQLLQPTQMRSDPQYWDAVEKADPPKPRKPHEKDASPPRTYIAPKRRTEEPVKSMEAQQIEALGGWLEQRLLSLGATRLSQTQAEVFNDFERVVQLAKTGYLGKGKRLQSIGYRLETLSDEAALTLERRELSFRDIEIQRSEHE